MTWTSPLLGLDIRVTFTWPMWARRMCRRPHAWDLTDLQLCVDLVELKHGLHLDTRFSCNHATRRHLLRLFEGRFPSDLTITADREMPSDVLSAKATGTNRVFFLYPSLARIGDPL